MVADHGVCPAPISPSLPVVWVECQRSFDVRQPFLLPSAEIGDAQTALRQSNRVVAAGFDRTLRSFESAGNRLLARAKVLVDAQPMAVGQQAIGGRESRVDGDRAFEQRDPFPERGL